MEKSAFSPLYEAVKARLVALRKAAGMTQRELAAKLKRDHSVITRLEQGERRIDCLELYHVARACGAKPEAVASQIMRDIRALELKSRRPPKPARKP